jgi:hypothetical protein
MTKLNFQFYPPKKQQDLSLVPYSTIMGVSASIVNNLPTQNSIEYGVRYNHISDSVSRDEIKNTPKRKGYTLYNNSVNICKDID